MRSVATALQTALGLLAEPTILVLVEMSTGERWTSHHKSHAWDSETWTAVGIEVTGLRESLNAEAPRADLRILSMDASLQASIASDSYRGETARIRFIRTDDIGTDTAPLWDTTYTVDTDGSDENELRLLLSSSDAVQGTEVPRISTREAGCQRVFKVGGCSYRGALTSCDKTLHGPNGCIAHFPDLTDPVTGDTIPQHYPYLAFSGRVAGSLTGSA